MIWYRVVTLEKVNATLAELRREAQEQASLKCHSCRLERAGSEFRPIQFDAKNAFGGYMVCVVCGSCGQLHDEEHSTRAAIRGRIIRAIVWVGA